MKSISKMGLILGVAILLMNAMLKSGSQPAQGGSFCPALSMTAFAAETVKPPVTNAPAKGALPRLVDLGANKCIPCKMMAPVLEDLKTNYLGQLEVEFIDVWKDPEAGKPYKISLIPTQIFYDASGRELFRHEGFFAKKDILVKWKELGVELGGPKAKAGSAKVADKTPK